MQGDSADDSLPPEFDVDELEEKLRAAYAPEPEPEAHGSPEAELSSGMGSVVVYCAPSMRGEQVFLCSLTRPTVRYSGVVGATNGKASSRIAAVFPVVEPTEYLAFGALYHASRLSVWPNHQSVVDWSKEG